MTSVNPTVSYNSPNLNTNFSRCSNPLQINIEIIRFLSYAKSCNCVLIFPFVQVLVPVRFELVPTISKLVAFPFVCSEVESHRPTVFSYFGFFSVY